MTIERVINHGIAYLRLTASLGLKKVGGRVVQRRKVVLSLGPMSRHDDGKPDYLRRLRESYRAGRPLIKELEPSVDAAAKGKVTVTFNAGDPTCLGKPRRMAATILDPLFNALVPFGGGGDVGILWYNFMHEERFCLPCTDENPVWNSCCVWDFCRGRPVVRRVRAR